MKYPLSGTYKSGWHLAQEFINMYMGYGGEFFTANKATLHLDEQIAIKTLKMLKTLTAYMPKEILTYDPNIVQSQWLDSKVAIVNLWTSRYPALEAKDFTKTAISP